MKLYLIGFVRSHGEIGHVANDVSFYIKFYHRSINVYILNVIIYYKFQLKIEIHIKCTYTCLEKNKTKLVDFEIAYNLKKMFYIHL